MGSPEVAADASTHLKGEGEPHCRWAIAGSGPLREKEEERAERSAAGYYRSGVCRRLVPWVIKEQPILPITLSITLDAAAVY